MRALLIATTLSTQCKREDAAPSPRGAGYARAGNQYARYAETKSKKVREDPFIAGYAAKLQFLAAAHLGFLTEAASGSAICSE